MPPDALGAARARLAECETSEPLPFSEGAARRGHARGLAPRRCRRDAPDRERARAGEEQQVPRGAPARPDARPALLAHREGRFEGVTGSAARRYLPESEPSA